MKSYSFRREERFSGLLQTNSIFDNYVRKIFGSLEDLNYNPNIIFQKLIADYVEEAKSAHPPEIKASEEDKSWYQRIGSFWVRTYAYRDLAEKINATQVNVEKNTELGLIAPEFVTLLNDHNNWKDKNDSFIQLLNAFFSFFPHNIDKITNETYKSFIATNDVDHTFYRNTVLNYVNKIIQTKPIFVSHADFKLIKQADKLTEVIALLIEHINLKNDKLYFFAFNSLVRAADYVNEEQANSLLPLCEQQISSQDYYVRADAYSIIARMIEKINPANMSASFLQYLRDGMKHRLTYFPTVVIASKLLLMQSPIMTDEKFNFLILTELTKCRKDLELVASYFSDKGLTNLYADSLDMLMAILYGTKSELQQRFILDLLDEELSKTQVSPQVLNVFAKLAAQGAKNNTHIQEFIDANKTKIANKLTNHLDDINALDLFTQYVEFVTVPQIQELILPLLKRSFNHINVGVQHKGFVLLNCLLQLKENIVDKNQLVNEFLPFILAHFPQLNSAANTLETILPIISADTIAQSVLPKILAEQQTPFNASHITLDNQRFLKLLASVIPYLDERLVENLLWPNVKKEINLSFVPSAPESLDVLENIIHKASASLRLKEILPWLLELNEEHPAGPAVRFINCISDGLGYPEHIYIGWKILTKSEDKLLENTPDLIGKLNRDNDDLKLTKACYNSESYKPCIIN